MKTPDRSHELRFGDVTLDLDRRLLFRNGKPQPLSELRWKALMLMIERHPGTVAKEELQKVLGTDYDTTLKKHIEILRKVLGDTGKRHRFIKTEYREGYRFIASPDANDSRVAVEMAPKFETTPTTPGKIEDAGAGNQVSEPALSGLVALYNFVRDANDETRQHDGEVVGGVCFVRPGRWYAAEFDGKTGYVEVPDHPSLRLKAFTLAAWINPTRVQNAGSRIIEKGNSNSYWIYVNTDGEVVVGFRGDKYYPYNVVSHEPLEINQWRHVAGTYDGTTLALYLNGAMIRRMIYAATPDQSAEPLRIGWKFNGIPEDRFAGYMRGVRIYNRALSESEIKKICVPSAPLASVDWIPSQVQEVTAADERPKAENHKGSAEK